MPPPGAALSSRHGTRCGNIPVPQWLRDGKFGIYTHWGIYSVPAYGKNGTWYAHNMYTDPDSDDEEAPGGYLRAAR